MSLSLPDWMMIGEACRRSAQETVGSTIRAAVGRNGNDVNVSPGLNGVGQYKTRFTAANDEQLHYIPPNPVIDRQAVHSARSA